MPDAADRLAAEIAAAEHELGAHGRVLVRPSGTEPLVRVMVEARRANRPRRATPTGTRRLIWPCVSIRTSRPDRRWTPAQMARSEAVT